MNMYKFIIGERGLHEAKDPKIQNFYSFPNDASNHSNGN